MILFIYWIETGIIGFWSVIKINIARGKPKQTTELKTYYTGREKVIKNPSGLSLTIPLISIIVFFMFFHSIILSMLFSFTADNNSTVNIFKAVSQAQINLIFVFIASLLLIFSHGVSFFTNFILRKEYKKTTPEDVMLQPIKRIMIMHFVVIISGFFIFLTIQNKFGASFLIIIKTVIDIYSHYKEHNLE